MRPVRSRPGPRSASDPADRRRRSRRGSSPARDGDSPLDARRRRLLRDAGHPAEDEERDAPDDDADAMADRDPRVPELVQQHGGECDEARDEGRRPSTRSWTSQVMRPVAQQPPAAMRETRTRTPSSGVDRDRNAVDRADPELPHMPPPEDAVPITSRGGSRARECLEPRRSPRLGQRPHHELCAEPGGIDAEGVRVDPEDRAGLTKERGTPLLGYGRR
jgi:hypothetical protein